MSLGTRRLVRIVRTGSPAAVVTAFRRELALQQDERRLERALASDGPLVVGPFLGEVGYELLFWRPYVLRLLRRHEVERERVTVVSRGGSGTWYAGVAARSIDAFELMSPDEVRERMEQRALRTGQRKQVTLDSLDRELLDRARATTGPAHALHPLHMYWRTRFLWEGLRPAEDAFDLGDYDDLPAGELPAEVAERLPARFVAVKAYFNDCIPDSDATRASFGELVARLADVAPVVLLEAGVSVDDHSDWSTRADRVVPVGDLMRPETNLATQAAVVARADALVSTYGGFSYTGPFLGIPTIALASQPEANPLHEQILRTVRPAGRFERLSLEDPERVATRVREWRG